MKRWQNIFTAVLLFGALGVCFLFCLFHESKETSLSEKRKLQQLPKLTLSTVLDGSFMTDFESYAADQFPAREGFRNIHAVARKYVFFQQDVNGYYFTKGSIGKLPKALSSSGAQKSADKVLQVYEAYLKDTDCSLYYGVVPDKNWFLRENRLYPLLDYDALYAIIDGSLSPVFKKVSIEDALSLNSYYNGDPHWRQEKLLETAQALAEQMGASLSAQEYTYNAVENYKGTYLLQSGMPMKGETLYYLTSPLLNSASVYHFETGKTTGVYDLDKLSTDPYDVYLSGADALLTVTNPEGGTGKNLIVFRDSFGSSLAPLLLSGYDTVTLVDLRYVSWRLLASFITFTDQDVLFLLSPEIWADGSIFRA